MTDALFNVGSAVFSPCRRYRYRLTRDGINAHPERPGYVAWIMLNPSLADAAADDRTIGRVRGFTRRAGYGSFVVVNLYAWISPHPEDLRCEAPCGPDNDAAIRDACEHAQLIVCAWGADPMAPARARVVEQVLDGLPLFCLGTNDDGSPKHPLYLKGTTELVPYRVAATVPG